MFESSTVAPMEGDHVDAHNSIWGHGKKVTKAKARTSVPKASQKEK